MTAPARLCILLLLLAGPPGCQPDVRCDEGQVYQRGACVVVDAGAPEETDACTDAGHTHYGDPCTEHAACPCPTNWCAVMPGASTGVCTHTGCLDDPGLCPADWSCLDLSVFQPDLPSICVPPA
jgi:hypothetical protein